MRSKVATVVIDSDTLLFGADRLHEAVIEKLHKRRPGLHHQGWRLRKHTHLHWCNRLALWGGYWGAWIDDPFEWVYNVHLGPIHPGWCSIGGTFRQGHWRKHSVAESG
jgi:hypothetical protein